MNNIKTIVKEKLKTAYRNRYLFLIVCFILTHAKVSF